MLVDQTTLSDLEIFGDVAGRGGVLALLDDAETESGRRALRRRLGKPFSEVSSIQDTQKAVKFFILEPKRRFVQRASSESVERYLDSNIDLGPAKSDARSALEVLWLSLRHPDLCRELRDGVASTGVLLHDVAEFAGYLVTREPPSVLSSLAREILTVCEEMVARRARIKGCVKRAATYFSAET